MTVSGAYRRQAILAQIYRDGHVQVNTLSRELGVSVATIRRDLKELATEGIVELTHGGALVRRNSDYSFMSKMLRNTQEKMVIGRLAADLVQDGDQIFLDSGTTCFHMAPYLRAKRDLCVIVNSIRTAQELFTSGLRVLLLGGQYRPDRMDAVGPMAAASLDQLRGYKAFFGTDGLGMDFGPTARDIESASLFGQAVRSARQAILLADHTKFDAPALYRIAQWKDISKVITDKRPSDQWMEFFEQRNIQVIYPQNDCSTGGPDAQVTADTSA